VRAALIALGALALACASEGSGSGSRPDWVDAPPSAYPRSAWVTGAATGTSAEAARANARAELSRVFRSRVESEVTDYTASETVSGPDGGSRSSVVEKLSIDTKVSTEGTFEGVRVAETWRDPGSSTWHALAVVEKSAMRRIFAADLEEAGRRVEGDLARADSAPTPLGRARALLDAHRASRERDLIAARARVVGHSAGRFQPGTADIEHQLDMTLWNTRFQVEALEVDPSSGSPKGSLPKLREALEERITGIGFRVVGSGSGAGEEANVFLECRMSLQEVPRGFEGHFFRWEGAFELKGAQPDATVLLASQASGGESYATASIARTRALAKGAQKLAADLEGQISRYLRETSEH
jgi:hypothetical protein